MLRTVQYSWSGIDYVHFSKDAASQPEIQLVFAFGSRSVLTGGDLATGLRSLFPNAQILIGSTAGEITGTTVSDNTLSVTGISFDKTRVRAAQTRLSESVDRRAAGREIAQALQADDLAVIFILSDGQNVNGSELVQGLNAELGGKIPVVGGLAGDGSSFETTLVGLNDNPSAGVVAAVALYGKDLSVRCGSQGGWEPFGPERVVTSAKENVLYQLDGVSALDLYKSYLGDRAADLPGSGLLFPLSIRLEREDHATVRTLLGIDNEANSLTFAGDVPTGSIVRLMRASRDKLLDGAREAALACRDQFEPSPELAILVSCVGRKLVLDQRVEEEVEEVHEVLGDATLCGFYSYGELSPTGNGGSCELHNQTMTITTLAER